MTDGYIWNVFRLNLTPQSISPIDNKQYEEYGGEHGIGSSIFGDLVGNQLPFEGLDPRNVVIIMTSPLSGVVVPSAMGRCEVQYIGPQSYRVEWFTLESSRCPESRGQAGLKR